MGPVGSLTALLQLSSLLQEALQLPAGCLLRLLCLCLLLRMLLKIINCPRVARLHLRRLIPACKQQCVLQLSTIASFLQQAEPHKQIGDAVVPDAGRFLLAVIGLQAFAWIFYPLPLANTALLCWTKFSR